MPIDGGREGLVRWTTVVAWHEVVAEWRHQSRVEPTADLDPPGEGDPANIVEYRLMVEAVTAGFKDLSVGDQEAVMSRLDGTRPESRPETSRTKVRRHRARQHLAARVDWTASE